MRRVILESPYAGQVTRNRAYARACVHDCIARDESPIASHLVFTQPGILDDKDPKQRRLGMEAGWAWIHVADAMVVYQDFGISSGMQEGIDRATTQGLPVEYRTLRNAKKERKNATRGK